MTITIDELAAFCKKKGFVYPSSEIYNGISGFWDLGPLGTELNNNIKQSFWNFFVRSRENMVGIEASIISHPRTWKASGHLENFGDLVIICSKCKERARADHLIQEKTNINVEGMPIADINKIIQEHKICCGKCKGAFEELKKFNLLFETRVGAAEDKSSVAYLRGETAQGMFLNFKTIADTARVKLPFGIVQVGTCFRNEIAPRDFLFRCREFHIGEFEFFIHPQQVTCSALTSRHLDLELPLLSAEMQDQNKDTLVKTTIKEMLHAKKLDDWHAFWLAEQVLWLTSLGLSIDHLKIREHTKQELSHYSSATFDLDYLYPFGSKELGGNANRGQYDLTQHMKESGKDMSLFVEETKERIIPRVIEPTFGMDRIFLAVLCEGYTDDKQRGNVVLRLLPALAPVKVAVFPLLSNKEALTAKARAVFDMLKEEMAAFYDASGSIGRRYARQDEAGTPYCVTIDFDTISTDIVTVRDRDSAAQIKVPIAQLVDTLTALVRGKKSFSTMKG